MRWWETQTGGATRGKLIALLRRAPSTIEELSAELDITDNAVRPHIQTLQSAGIVMQAGTRQSVGAGKPATLYRIAPSAVGSLSAAYAPVLSALLDTMRAELKPSQVSALLRETGRKLAASESVARGSLESRVNAAAEVLSALGGEIDVQRTENGYRICGFVCSLSAALSAEPTVCTVIEEFVSTMVKAPVHECCDKSAGNCRLDIAVR